MPILLHEATGAGALSAVSERVVLHPLGSMYVIIKVPADSMFIMPDALFMVATAALLLLHVPPVVELSVAVVPVHMAEGAIIAAGSMFTVTTAVALLVVQLLLSV